MMNSKLGYIFAFLLLFGVLSCVDEIDLKVGEVDEVLVVDGRIYNDGTPPIVTIFKSAAFESGPDGVSLPVGGARVQIQEIGGPIIDLNAIIPLRI